MIFSLFDLVLTTEVKALCIGYIDNGVLETSFLSIVYRPVVDEDFEVAHELVLDIFFLAGIVTTIKQAIGFFTKERNDGEK